VANWVINDLLSALAAAEKGIADCPISAQALDELVNLIDDGKINTSQGKTVFAEMFATGKPAAQIVQEKGLAQESDAGAIEALCAQAIAASPKAVAEYKAGKAQAINAIKGQVMKLSQGKANPNVVGEILARLLA
jgi:aspartyl-tRNA(Asn)/glutamyl-tRNA(Gln) amidotransferase subunit B